MMRRLLLLLLLLESVRVPLLQGAEREGVGRSACSHQQSSWQESIGSTIPGA